ncbi:SDR family oxidoreductase [Nocardioides daeguensis]|uniref:SDR family oxidoreductase n=1 Tax=Nocardioides daeguensis TaxID=908359 RepID=A0ABP6UV23_9ACTN|nr:SDR family oxidoreductase [Nocardioides daeguensis]MBV6725575.1 SDR family oxidoreductase [Nocardioides daeguensis]MCR1771435.1 SDR family oxidoreductase [Nocardioides daeguensis]
MSQPQHLTGRHVVITGAARGIGRATAAELLGRGARVSIGDIDREAAARTAAELGERAVGLHVDVTDPSSFATFLDEARAAHGGVDVLVNNAGVMPIGAYLDSSAEVERRSIEINVLGPLTGMRLVLPEMVARGGGHVVNVASTAGRAAIPGGVAYCAAKAAIVHGTEAMRVELGHTGVDFTVVMPGFVNTDLVAGTKGLRMIPNLEPEDVATAIAEALRTRRKDVFVPWVMGPIIRTQPFLGRRLRDFFNRRMGAYDAFLDIDQSQRAHYSERVGRS